VLLGGARRVPLEAPGRVKTRLGTLEFTDGSPIAGTVDLVVDNLDCMRVVEIIPSGMPAASLEALRPSHIESGLTRHTAPVGWTRGP
jgi:hypothetical protein